MEPLPFIPEPATTVQNNTPASLKKAPRDTSGEDFNPMLDKAISKQEEKVLATEQSAQPAGNNETADLGKNTKKTLADTETEDTAVNNTAKGSFEDIAESTTETVSKEAANIFTEGPSNSRDIIPGELVSQAHTQKLATTEPPVNPHAELSASPNARFLVDPMAKIVDPMAKLVDPMATLSVKPLNIQQNTDPAFPPSKAGTLLMRQIQQILDEGKNEGAIVIKGSTEVALNSKESSQQLQTLSTPVLDASREIPIQARQTGLGQIMAEDTPKTAVPQSLNTETSRQNVTEQFLNAKFGSNDKNQNENTQQQSEQRGNEGQNKNTLQQVVTGSGVNTLSADAGITDTSFNQHLGMSTSTVSSTTTPPPVAVEGKYMPGATVHVPEDKMVDTLIQRFNVNPRLQTSKLSMQLHPVELGKLKVDITVKENTISANIVAGSQQVLETLDKNIARLRTVLEDQGFTIDSFTISTNTNDSSDQQLFQEQFASHQHRHFTGKSTLTKSDGDFDSLLEEQDFPLDSTEPSQGINLTA